MPALLPHTTCRCELAYSRRRTGRQTRHLPQPVGKRAGIGNLYFFHRIHELELSGHHFRISCVSAHLIRDAFRVPSLCVRVCACRHAYMHLYARFACVLDVCGRKRGSVRVSTGAPTCLVILASNTIAQNVLRINRKASDLQAAQACNDDARDVSTIKAVHINRQRIQLDHQ